MKTHISLLRGINVSGQKLIKMAELRKMYKSLGFSDVRSYIQSGNVIFSAPEEEEGVLIHRIAAAILDTFGHEVSVLVRTVDELERVIGANPFPKEAERDPKKVHVVFLAEKPEEEMVKELAEVKSDREGVVCIGRELFLSLPDGAARTKLTNAVFERKLKMPTTARNWRTVTILADMAEQD